MTSFDFRDGDLFAYLELFEDGECALMLDRRGEMRMTVRLTTAQAEQLSAMLGKAAPTCVS